MSLPLFLILGKDFVHILFGDTQWTTPGLQIPDATWDDLVQICEERRHVVRRQIDKPNAGWVSNAILHHNATSRKLDDVALMAAWIGLDFDHCNWTLKQLLANFAGMACIAYSTTRSTSMERRWRVLTPLSRQCDLAESAGVWRAINIINDEQVDGCTKNCNRLHYLPAAWIGGNNEYHVQNGDAWDVDALLRYCPPEEPVSYAEVYELGGQKRPDGTEIITASMVQKHMVLSTKGGRFFRLLLAAATMHKANGWNLDASELANAALTVSPYDSNGVKRAMSGLREAERAISYIASHVTELTPEEKLMKSVRWRAGLH